jgi:tetratricopeptide (TPR) repeat protein
MSGPRETSDRTSAASVSELFARYLERQVDAQAEGLGFAPASDEVEPYDSVPVQPIDPRLAWDEARSVLKSFAHLSPSAVKAPLEWPQLVAGYEPAVALAFALGNYPQLVRDLHRLLGGDLASLSTRPAGVLADAALLEWAQRQAGTYPRLLAAGVLRLARAYDQAAELLEQMGLGTGEWRPIWENEKAALAWHRGQIEEALTMWQAQPESVPVLFNRGMACLFLGRIEEAHPALGQAVATLPDSSSWHHLGQLYLALASGAR